MSTRADIKTIIEQLKHEVDTVSLGNTIFLLGMGIEGCARGRTARLAQEAYVRTVLEMYGMTESHPAKTP